MTTPGGFGGELRALRAALGVSQAELGRLLGGRSGDYISLIERGIKPGNNLRDAVSALATRGQVVAPPRRTDRSGAPVRVRGKGGTTVAPVQAAAGPSRGRFGVQTSKAPGRTSVTVTAPKSRGAGRRQASDALGAELERAGRRKTQTRVRFSVTVQAKDGTQRTVQRGAKGGYSARLLARRLRRTYGGDAFALIADQFLETEYEEAVGAGGVNIVGVTLEFF